MREIFTEAERQVLTEAKGASETVYGVKITDKTGGDFLPKAKAVLHRIPSAFLHGLREILVIRPEHAKMYLTHGAEGEYLENIASVYVLGDEGGITSFAERVAHEIGHHVVHRFLTGEQRANLMREVGLGIHNWSEDFAAMFGALMSGSKARAMKRHPHSYAVFKQIA